MRTRLLRNVFEVYRTRFCRAYESSGVDSGTSHAVVYTSQLRYCSSEVGREDVDRTVQQDPLHHDDEAVLYVHWPYCERRCSYCNFNKYISKSVDHARMADCLVREGETLLELSGVQKINSIFFGGGTPSLALPSTVAKVIETVKKHVTFSSGSEITLEANPTKLETSRLKDFKAAGVTRLSLGIQALNTDDLQVLGRDHGVQEALGCLEEAKALYPGWVSIDVIFGRPGQTLTQWTHELQELLALCDGHMSLYQLTLERGTQLYKWVQNGQYCLPGTDTMADMYIEALQILEAHGLYRYEVANFAKKGCESEHNQAYWQGRQYIGIGPGAHGRFIPQKRVGGATPVREARIQTLEPPNWMLEVERYGHGTRKIVPQSRTDRLEEMIILGLRTTEGIPNTRWSALSAGQDLGSVFGATPSVRDFINTGLLQLDDRGLRATSKGITVIDSILPYLLETMTATSILAPGDDR